MSKPRIDKKLQEQIDYYRETGSVLVEMPNTLTGVRTVSNAFKTSELFRYIEEKGGSVNEYFEGTWQKIKDLVVSENDNISSSIILTDEESQTQIVNFFNDKEEKEYSMLFFFEKNTINDKSMYHLFIGSLIQKAVKEVVTTSKILDILNTPNWKSYASAEIAEVIENKDQWYRLEEGWGLNSLWEKVK